MTEIVWADVAEFRALKGWLPLAFAPVCVVHLPEYQALSFGKVDVWRQRNSAQFCDAAYNAAGRHFFRGIVPAAVFPGMFVNIFQKNGRMP